MPRRKKEAGMLTVKDQEAAIAAEKWELQNKLDHVSWLLHNQIALTAHLDAVIVSLRRELGKE